MRKRTVRHVQSRAEADAFGIDLKLGEDEAIVRMTDLIEMPCAQAKGKGANETAKVTASVKVLELLLDVLTPITLKVKLEPLRQKALSSLRDVVENGTVASAAAAASAFVLRTSARAAPGAWPPDTESVAWKLRMAKAEEICKL